MAYEDLSALQRKAEQLRGPFKGGLIQLLRNRSASKVEKELEEKERRNQQNRQHELAQLLRGAETGMVGGPGQGMGPLKTAPLSEFAPTDPEVQALAAKLRMDRATQGQEEYTLAPGAQRYRGGEMIAQAPYSPDSTGSEFGLSPITFRNPDNSYSFGQLDKSGGLRMIETPQGVEYVPDSGRMGFNPANILEQGGAANTVAADKQEAVGDVETQQLLERQAQQRALEREIESRSAKPRLDGALANIQMMRDQVAQLMEHAGTGTMTGLSGYLDPRNLVGQGRDARALLDSLKSKVFVTTLQSMRDLSPTGGAVGNVSNMEGKRFEEQLVALDTAQTDEQFKLELEKLLQLTDESAARLQNAYQSQFGSAQPPADDPITAADEILRRAGIIQ